MITKGQSATLIALLTGEEWMPKDWRMTYNRAWDVTRVVKEESYRCGYCGYEVSSEKGWTTESTDYAFIRICPHCNGPTFFAVGGRHWPGPKEGRGVTNLSKAVAAAYDEASNSITVGAFTGSVMLCRKILMNVAVEKGAEEGLAFKDYVDWLGTEGYAPKGSEEWLEYIKDQGNEANHEIVPKGIEEARKVLLFTEQLLRNALELPSLVPPKPAKPEGKDSSGP